jgi:hypothetical protein
MDKGVCIFQSVTFTVDCDVNAGKLPEHYTGRTNDGAQCHNGSEGAFRIPYWYLVFHKGVTFHFIARPEASAPGETLISNEDFARTTLNLWQYSSPYAERVVFSRPRIDYSFTTRKS